MAPPQSFHDEASLIEMAEALGKQALQQGLIPGFAVYYFPDSSQFFIPQDDRSKPLTPEQAYMQLKRLVEQSDT